MIKKADYNSEYFTDISLKSGGVFKKYLLFLHNLNLDIVSKKVLDVGCGKGEFFGVLNESNEMFGSDISEIALEEAKRRFPHGKFFIEDLNVEINETFRQEKYDLITMFDVIEHLYNFENLKSLLENNLNNGGHFVVTTPNANSLLRFLLGNKTYTGEYDDTHRMLFTPYTLDFFLRKSGLKKVELSTPYSFYFKSNFLTRRILFGGQILAIYKK